MLNISFCSSLTFTFLFVWFEKMLKALLRSLSHLVPSSFLIDSIWFFISHFSLTFTWRLTGRFPSFGFDHLRVYHEMGFGLHVKVTSTLRDTIATCILNFPSSSSIIDVSNVLVIYRPERVNNHFSFIKSVVFLHLTQQFLDIVNHFSHISSQSYFFSNWLVQSFMTLRPL